MTIAGLKCNHMTRPLGFTLENLVFSWKAESGTADFQTAARVEIALDAGFHKPVHDSGLRNDVDSIAYTPVPALCLQPETRYFWRVTVLADDGSTAVSDSDWFETGKMGNPFAGEWISAQDTDTPSVLRKTFILDLKKPIASARLYASAAGVYEAEINAEMLDELDAALVGIGIIEA